MQVIFDFLAIHESLRYKIQQIILIFLARLTPSLSPGDFHLKPNILYFLRRIMFTVKSKSGQNPVLIRQMISTNSQTVSLLEKYEQL